MRYLLLELCSRFFFSSFVSSFVHVVSLSVMDGSWVLQKNTTVTSTGATSSVFVCCGELFSNYDVVCPLVTPRGTLQAFF